MGKGIRTVRYFDYEVAVEGAYLGYDEGEYDSFAFVGDLDAIKEILAVLLSDYDMEFIAAHIDTVEYDDNMYQLTIDENELITVAPVLEYSNDDIFKGYVLIEGIGKWFVDDSVSTRFVRTLEKGGYNFEVFEAYDDESPVECIDTDEPFETFEDTCIPTNRVKAFKEVYALKKKVEDMFKDICRWSGEDFDW